MKAFVVDLSSSENQSILKLRTRHLFLTKPIKLMK